MYPTDYLKAHSKGDLLAQVKQAPQWFPQETNQNSILVAADQFVTATPVDTDWMVQGVIERGANGFFCAAPKGGKSWAAIDMCLSLALGVQWLGFAVPRPFRVALVSREDNPSLTGWRIRNLQSGKTGDHSLLAQNFYVNTRSQSSEFLLDNPEQWQELVDALKERQIEFVVFDVFNVCHGADENDNTQMRAVLRQLSAIQTSVGCGIGVIHHYSKAETGSMVQRLRGASAISGWAEWLIGISMADEEHKIRRMDFECKAACPPDPIYYRIQTALNGAIRLEREERTPQPATQRRREGSAAERFMN
jgi:RecA-family ATPase